MHPLPGCIHSTHLPSTTGRTSQSTTELSMPVRSPPYQQCLASPLRLFSHGKHPHSCTPTALLWQQLHQDSLSSQVFLPRSNTLLYTLTHTHLTYTIHCYYHTTHKHIHSNTPHSNSHTHTNIHRRTNAHSHTVPHTLISHVQHCPPHAQSLTHVYTPT